MDEREPDAVLIAAGSMLGLHICSQCGAAVLQPARDLTDRVEQHQQWHLVHGRGHAALREAP